MNPTTPQTLSSRRGSLNTSFTCCDKSATKLFNNYYSYLETQNTEKQKVFFFLLLETCVVVSVPKDGKNDSVHYFILGYWLGLSMLC